MTGSNFNFNFNSRLNINLALDIVETGLDESTLSATLESIPLTPEVRSCLVDRRQEQRPSILSSCVNLDPALLNAADYTRTMLGANAQVDPQSLVGTFFTGKVDQETIQCFTSAESDQAVDSCVTEARTFVGRESTQPAVERPAETVDLPPEALAAQNPPVAPVLIPTDPLPEGDPIDFNQYRLELYKQLEAKVKEDLLREGDASVLKATAEKGEDWTKVVHEWAKNLAQNIFPEHTLDQRGDKARVIERNIVLDISRKVVKGYQDQVVVETEKSVANQNVGALNIAYFIANGAIPYALPQFPTVFTPEELVPGVGVLWDIKPNKNAGEDYWGWRIGTLLFAIPPYLNLDGIFGSSDTVELSTLQQFEAPGGRESGAVNQLIQEALYVQNPEKSLLRSSIKLGLDLFTYQLLAGFNRSRAMTYVADHTITANDSDINDEPACEDRLGPDGRPITNCDDVGGAGSNIITDLKLASERPDAYARLSEQIAQATTAKLAIFTQRVIPGEAWWERLVAGPIATGAAYLLATEVQQPLGESFFEEGRTWDYGWVQEGKDQDIIYSPDEIIEDIVANGKGKAQKVSDDLTNRATNAALFAGVIQTISSEEQAPFHGNVAALMVEQFANSGGSFFDIKKDAPVYEGVRNIARDEESYQLSSSSAKLAAGRRIGLGYEAGGKAAQLTLNFIDNVSSPNRDFGDMGAQLTLIAGLSYLNLVQPARLVENAPSDVDRGVLENEATLTGIGFGVGAGLRTLGALGVGPFTKDGGVLLGEAPSYGRVVLKPVFGETTGATLSWELD